VTEANSQVEISSFDEFQLDDMIAKALLLPQPAPAKPSRFYYRPSSI